MVSLNFYRSLVIHWSLKFLKRSLYVNDSLKPSVIKQNFWNKLSQDNKIKVNRKKINVNFLNSNLICYSDNFPTPFSVVSNHNKSVLKNILIAKVNGIPWDLNKLLNADCNLEVLGFDNLYGRDAFWRSTAFLLNGIIENMFDGKIYNSDSNDNGFFCDSFLPNKNISSLEFDLLEKEFSKAVSSQTDFERIDISFETALELYSFNPYKLSYLEQFKDNIKVFSLYRCLGFIDICEAPLVKNTGQLKHIKLIGNGSIKLKTDDKHNSLQRIFGISFPDEKLYQEWMAAQEDAKNRDHRQIGQDQKLFFFHNSSPGSAFMLPKGTHICNKLIGFIREQYRNRGFLEVTTPIIYDSSLWKTSGHWDLYQNNLFKIPLSTDQMMSLKPMNCPAHCLIYANQDRFAKDLPIRLADFGALHRNEPSGALTGLTRVRKFHQDDAHIFCRRDQIGQEIQASLDFLEHVYRVLDFGFHLCLSTRPDQYLGELQMWEMAEQQLKDSLEKFGRAWSLNPGDGAFYGPKIDISITDALNKHHQCATIQLDFQLPIRFDLKYWMNKSANESERPVIIHRAILGSVERLLAILIESNRGKWPFWLNPNQVLVVPVSEIFSKYAFTVCEEIRASGFMCDVDLAEDTGLNRKIRLGQIQQYNCILVIGQKEIDNGQVAVRTRDGLMRGSWTVSQLLDKFRTWDKQRYNQIENDFHI